MTDPDYDRYLSTHDYVWEGDDEPAVNPRWTITGPGTFTIPE